MKRGILVSCLRVMLLTIVLLAAGCGPLDVE